MVELGVVEAVQEVDRARSGGGQADTHLIGPLGVRAGHESRHRLVADLDVVDPVFRALERAHDPVDAVAGVAVDPLDTPLGEALGKEVGDVHGKLLSLSAITACPRARAAPSA